MAVSRGGIEVKGLRDLNRGLRQLDRELPKEMRDALSGVAELVRSAAVPKVPVVTGAARASIRVRKSATSARLAVGGTKAPYYPWLDFGGRVGRGRSIQREVVAGGRYIYPTITEKNSEIVKLLDEVMVEFAKRAGFD